MKRSDAPQRIPCDEHVGLDKEVSDRKKKLMELRIQGAVGQPFQIRLTDQHACAKKWLGFQPLLPKSASEGLQKKVK